jgi:hypothetical protein
MCFTMFLIDFHDFQYLIMKSMIMMYHDHHFRNILNNSGYLIIIYHLHVIIMHHLHHFRNMSSLILNISGYLIIIYHLHVIVMHHLHPFRNLSSLIFNIFSTCYHHLSSSCDYDASSSSFFATCHHLSLTSSAHVIIIYHLHVIVMHHLHLFRNMSSLIFNIFSTWYHHLSSSCDCGASSSSFSQHVITYL